MSDSKPKPDIATLLVHAGERKEKLEGQPVSTPIYASTTFTYDSNGNLTRIQGWCN